MIDPIRRTALSILNRLERNHHTLDDILDSAVEATPISSRRDRNFIFALTYGTLRWRGRLDWILDQVSNTPVQRMNPKVRNILRLGLFQILFMDRVPKSAAVNTAVDLTKTVAGPKVSGFVNAVLRNAIRRRETISFPDAARNPVAALATRKSFPPWMIERWIEQMGHDETLAMCKTINTIAPLTLRTNTLKTDRQALTAALQADGEDPQPTPCSPLGLRLTRTNRSVPDLPGFCDGGFQVQDEAAQLVTFLLDPRPGEKILDACAGLGGKTGHIAQQMKNTGRITAVDHQSAKLNRLDQEMRRLGITIVSPKTVDLNNASTTTRLGVFDRVLVDAPCSGLGVLRRHPDAKWRHTTRTFSKMAKRQLQFLDHLAPLVKPGGILVYAVCSTEPEENERVIKPFLNNHSNFTVTPATPFLPSTARHLVTPDGYFRTLVHRDQMDGFFAVRFRKTIDQGNVKVTLKPHN
ncbi:MAG: 16S rRNA (cytosine(967)-C(5))-methyltransferase RsmB [Thermodesulfobacteriota bacterium]|nr:16S rRNA (cytosine(967)-C(5))-methyltransferase RsmB [Thermodesulfobacteriota bacterium]